MTISVCVFTFDINSINIAMCELCWAGCGVQTPVRPPQRRQERRKILGEKNVASSIAVDDSFLSSHNFSLASTGSYTDFQVSILISIGYEVFYCIL